jgi:hypothetical protein
MAAICFALLLSVSGFAQTTTTTATAVFGEGNVLLDSSGNMIVVDQGRSTTGVTITGFRHSFYMPLTRITVIPKGSSSGTTVEYNGSVQVIGVGSSAIYAIATTYTVSGTTLTTAQSLIAITASLPAGPALTGFPSFTLTSPVDAHVGPSDYISIISEPNGSTARTATVVNFSGGAFAQVSSATLP